MKILQIIQRPQLRGAEIFACQLSDELTKKGVKVDVAYIFPGDVSSLKFALNFIPVHGNIERRFWDFKAYNHLAKVIRNGGYDIVQANAGDTLKYAVLSKVIFGWSAKLVFRNANQMSRFIRNRFQSYFNRWLLSKCDHFISVSRNTLTDLIKIYQPATDRSISIPIGTYSSEGITAVGRDTTGPVFINIGSFVPEKNHEFLIEAFSIYYSKYGKGFLWLVGDGARRSLLEGQVKKLNILERVIFWGYRDEVIPILKGADIFVLPSLIEGLPAVVLEAVACEIPVIASAIGGIPELIEDGVTGILISEWNTTFYVKQMAALADDDEYKRKLVTAAKSRLRTSYTMHKIAGDFYDRYRLLASTME